MVLSYLRTLILYLVLVLSIRVMGKRQIGQMEASEFVVTMLVANLAAIPMQDSAIALYTGLVPILTVLGAELTLSGLILHSIRIRHLFCGKPVILIENGNLLQDNLRRTRVSLDELIGHLREKNVLTLDSVQYAILETDGNLSVFPYPEKGCHYLPITIIEDGQFFRENLHKAGKDALWLAKTLEERDADIHSTLLLTVDASNHVHWLRKEYRK
ncbi:MAG: DUF421 domain-containing protein [Oscillospiraceae bacterium]|nr:DUF421 domain-containing protein [Oscillospiraceae bacterium]